MVGALEAALGSRVVAGAAPVGSGSGGAYAGAVTLASGARAFVKAAPPWLAFPAASLAREAVVLTALPQPVPHARLLAAVSVDGWELLAVEYQPGRMPGNPWTAEDLDAAYHACRLTSWEPAPAGLTDGQLADTLLDDQLLQDTVHALTAGTFTPPATYGRSADLERTLAAYGPQLAALLKPLEDLAGDHLCHNDLRPDNLLICDGRAVILDWNWISRGPAWADLVGLLPMAHRQGLDVRPWLQRPQLADAREEHLDAFLAAVAAYMLSNLGAKPMAGCLPQVRHHQLLFAHDFVAFLAARHRWT